MPDTAVSQAMDQHLTLLGDYFNRLPFGNDTGFDDIHDALITRHDWQARYRYLLKLSEGLPPLPDDFKTDAYAVDGCTSLVWLVAEHNAKSDTWRFALDSDSRVVRAYLCILLSLINGHDRGNILATPLADKLDSLGLRRQLTSSRRQGLFAVWERVAERLNDNE